MHDGSNEDNGMSQEIQSSVSHFGPVLKTERSILIKPCIDLRICLSITSSHNMPSEVDIWKL